MQSARFAGAAIAVAAVAVASACASAPPVPVEAAPDTLAPREGSDIKKAEKDLEERIREVVVKERPNLRACYERGLEKNPALAGRVVLVLEVAQNGMASHVFEARRSGLGDDEVRCFARVLKAAHFHDGAGRAVRIEVPLAFSSKDPT